MRSIKCKMLIVGDGHIGKSSLLSTYAKRYFPTEYKPTQHQLFSVTPETNTKHPVQLTLVDTAGQEESRGYVAGYLKDSSISLVVVAFDLSFGPTFINARDQWIPLVRQTSPTAPILLVGTKLDVAQKEGWGTELSVVWCPFFPDLLMIVKFDIVTPRSRDWFKTQNWSTLFQRPPKPGPRTSSMRFTRAWPKLRLVKIQVASKDVVSAGLVEAASAVRIAECASKCKLTILLNDEYEDQV
ncbi:P-loop containing nucleoside triphosphate hydrolase protein [Blastocladiella britannica]|nr:P-loop containing nucleoside triphosphate hydrolase protein [Blastocladiella britannica]